MLDAWIIEEIRRREKRDRSRPQPQIERPSEPQHPRPDRPKDEPDDKQKRGVVIVDFTV